MKTVITSSDRSFINFGELKRYGSLFRYLSLRDVFVRYKQTRMGFAWSIVRPLVNTVIFGAIRFLVDKSNTFIDSMILASIGIVFWQLLSTTITDVSNSLSANSNILTKVYFPKILLPFSSILVCLIDFLIAFSIFLVLFIVFKGLPPWQIVFLPFVIIYGLVFCFSLGLISATASVRYRDVKFILPFLLQILLYASPVFLSSETFLNRDLPEWMKVVYQLNPLVFILNAYKFCFTGTFENFDIIYAASSVAITFVLFFISVKYFFNFEKSFADYI